MTDETTQETQDRNKKKLPAAPVLLEIARAEYQNERTRTSTIDAKTGITLPIIATYFFLVLQYTDIKKEFLSPIDMQNIAAVLYSVLPPLCYLASLVFSAISLLYLFRTITMQEYEAINPEHFRQTEMLEETKERFSAAIIRPFIESTNKNHEVNSRRCRFYVLGWRYALISLAIFIVYVFLKH